MNVRPLSLFDHLVSFLSFFVITVNLLFWLPVLVLAAATRVLFPFKIIERYTFSLVSHVYKMAVNVDKWWFTHVLKLSFSIDDGEGILEQLKSSDNSVIICNHRSWFDIFLLQTLFSSRGPLLRFLVKEELLKVPVLGWVCYVMNFPRLKRRGDAASRRNDMNAARSASLELGKTPGALLIFPEGTRFSESKRLARNSPFQYLLKPKPGGFSAIHSLLASDVMMIDVSIGYREQEANCWRCMSGAVSKIEVKISSSSAGEVGDAVDWLDRQWEKKEAWLASISPRMPTEKSDPV